MEKSKFNPNRIKLLLEYEGHGRVTDKQLAKMFNVKVDTIARWKIKSPAVFDKIAKLESNYLRSLEMPNKQLIKLLKMNPLTAYAWNKKRPNILINSAAFFIKYNLTFEQIYGL